MREAAIRQSPLPPIVPKKIRDIYQEALSVKHSPNSFAVQIGRALEAVQKDLGLPKRSLDELESYSPEGLGQIAIKLKDWRNIAAHSDSGSITDEQVGDIDSFFRLIIEHIYSLPDKLKSALAKIATTVDVSVDGPVN